MSNSRKDGSSEQTGERCIAELHALDVTRAGADAKKSSFIRGYKSFSRAGQLQLCREAGSVLRSKFNAGQRMEGVIHLIGCAFAHEKDWEAAKVFLDSVLKEATSAEYLRELSLVLLEIADYELSEHSSKVPLGQTILVLLTELGLQLAEKVGEIPVDSRELGRVVDYITTNLVARSNLNNMAMRISLVHYLSNCKLNSQSSQQLNRVISRFGQSLLDDMLAAFFDDKKRSNAAFFFLVEHLNHFFSSSAALAEMSHNVLKHYMLKHPADFPLFLASYCEFLPKDSGHLLNASKHISLLYRASIDISQRSLSEATGKILLKHLNLFKDVSNEAFVSQINETVNIVTVFGRQAKSPLLEEFLKDIKRMLDAASPAAQLQKPLTYGRRSSKEIVVKFARIGEKPSLLEQMIQLAG